METAGTPREEERPSAGLKETSAVPGPSLEVTSMSKGLLEMGPLYWEVERVPLRPPPAFTQSLLRLCRVMAVPLLGGLFGAEGPNVCLPSSY